MLSSPWKYSGAAICKSNNQIQKNQGRTKMVRTSSIKMAKMVRIRLDTLLGVKKIMFLTLLWMVKSCGNSNVIKQSKISKSFNGNGQGQVHSCAQTFNFSFSPLSVATKECWIWKKSNFQFLTAHLGAPTKVKFGVEHLTTVQNSILFSAYSPWCTKQGKIWHNPSSVHRRCTGMGRCETWTIHCASKSSHL